MGINVLSQPLASKKTTKKIHKLVKKAATAAAASNSSGSGSGSSSSSRAIQVRRGVKEVVKALRKNERGLAILAGDIFPIDVISHLPILLEEQNVPYMFVPSKQDLGAAACTKRPTSCVLIVKGNNGSGNLDEDVKALYESLVEEAKSLESASN